MGVLLLGFSIFLFISCISFLFTYRYDAAVAQTGRCVGCQAYHNWMGRLGAILSGFLFTHLGLGVMAWIPGLFLAGLYLLWALRPVSFWKYLGWASFFFFWINLFLGFIAYGSNLDILGGLFGYGAATYLEANIGKPGVILVLIFSAALFVMLAFNVTFGRVGLWLERLLVRKKEPPRDEETQQDPDVSEEEPAVQRIKVPLHHPENSPQELPEDFEFEVKEVAQEEPSYPPVDPPAIAEEKIPEAEKTEHLPSSAEPSPEIEPEQPQVVEFEVGGQEMKPASLVEKNPPAEPTFSVEGLEHIEDLELSPDTPVPTETIDMEEAPSGPYDPRLELSRYRMPDTQLLTEHSSGSVRMSKEELEANKNRIVAALANYNISIEHIKATIGPTVTLYEIVPAAGVRISKIKSLEDDIALSLAAFGIRIIAPIPGKGTIGIEVPNQNPEVVSMKSVLESEKFLNSNADLPIALGKTISNETYVADLAKMPHLLMAGATGQGKSVGINAILVSLLYKKHPAELKLVLVDPKKVELTLYQKIERHYLAQLPGSEEPIITDTKKVIHTLQSLCVEMDRRYDLLKEAGVRNLKEYNARFVARRLNPRLGHGYMPYIVLVVDEFADLIMTAGKEVEMPIARLAQLARAVGIHLIIATQRPSVNIITGTIKANFPARIAFRVSAKVDSRTILDASGADQLIGRGDMLLSLGSDLVRLQCAFVDTPEVERLCEFIGNQPGYPGPFELPEAPMESPEEPSPDFEPGRRDPLFEEAARIVVQTQQGSTSMLQRRMRLGYSRAGRIMDELEHAGIVGPSEGSKTRKVLIQDLETLERYLNSR
ncbi:MAG: DNA translocase FtsK [Flavobacteriales bacterium]|nr:DNA translocase FtsK [Flavobacteriales bacterium]